MTRLPAILPETATGKSKTLLDAVQKKLGRVPNLMRTLATAPAALEGYLSLSGALATGTLDAKTREQIALTVAEANLCEYCLAAHSAIGAMVGLTAEDVGKARQASAVTPRTDAILKLARNLVVHRGQLGDGELQAARRAGITDAEILETVAHVALNVLTNYTNLVAHTVVDFPAVAPAVADCSSGACGPR